jgi:hypothetical protein
MVGVEVLKEAFLLAIMACLVKEVLYLRIGLVLKKNLGLSITSNI